MSRRFTALLLATVLVAAPALAFRAPQNTASRPQDSRESRTLATLVLTDMNQGNKFADDMLRLAFKHVMGLLFFDEDTPPIDNCRKEMLNYYLPALVQQQASLEMLRPELARHMAEVYTVKELQWMKEFYATPFGRNMLNKQFEMNSRITRMMAQRYTAAKPQFADNFKTVEARCRDGAPVMPSAPSPSEALLGTDALVTEESVTP